MHFALVVAAAPLALRTMEIVDALSGVHEVTVCPTPAAAASPWVGDIPPELRLRQRVRPDAVVIVPATFNSINKWALGINDNPAMGVLHDALGLQTRVLVVATVAERLASHPSWSRSIDTLVATGLVSFLDPSAGEVCDRPPAVESGFADAITWNFNPKWLLRWLEG